jgi:hypothetical protein
MMIQLLKRTALLAIVGGLWIGAAAIVQAQKEVPAISGVWKLNVAASTNPNGPAPPAPSGGRRGSGDAGGGGGDQGGGGGGAGGGGGGGGDEGGGASTRARAAEGGELGAEELRRFNAMKALFFKAPPMMGIQATETDFKMILDPEKNVGFQHKTDGKKQAVNTPAGPADFKVKWDGAKVRREAETKDSFHVVEEYTLSPDGKQLFVTVKADSRMVRAVQLGDIKRVYDRQQ